MATPAPSSAASTTWSGMCARQHVIFIIGVIVGARVGAEPRRGGFARGVGHSLRRPGERAVGRRAAAHLGDANDDHLPHGGVCAARALLRIKCLSVGSKVHAEGDAPARAEGSACIRWYQVGLYSYLYSLYSPDLITMSACIRFGSSYSYRDDMRVYVCARA